MGMLRGLSAGAAALKEPRKKKVGLDGSEAAQTVSGLVSHRVHSNAD